MRIQGDDPQVYLPSSLVEVGKEWSKVWTTTASEMNDRFGTQQAPNLFKLEAQLGTFGQKITVTDKAWREEGKLGIEFLYTDPRTMTEQRVKRFLPMFEAKMYDELYCSVEHQLWYGVKQTKAGPNGYWKKTGSGVREILRDSWIEYYSSPLTVSRLKDYFMDIFFSREAVNNREVVLSTGTLGALMFHDMLAAEAASFLTLDTHFTQRAATNKTLGSSNSNHLKFGAQYTEYIGQFGPLLVAIRVVTLP